MRKKLLLSVLLAGVGLSVLTGCYNESQAQANIQLVFHDAELYPIPETIDKFVVRDRSGQVFYVKEDGQYSNTNRMTIIKIFNEK